MTQQAENLIEETKAEVDKIYSALQNYWIVKNKPRGAYLLQVRTLMLQCAKTY